MTWTIHYRHNGRIGFRPASSVELAIKRACELLDQGADVGQITSSAGGKTIGADEIKVTCAARMAGPLGRKNES
jgi:hypothetical protein